MPSAEKDRQTIVQASNAVARAYGEILGRKPDPQGFAAYQAQLLAGKSEEWLRADLRKSREYRDRQTARWLRLARVCGILVFALAISVLIALFSQNLRNVKIAALCAAGMCGAAYFYWISKYAVNVPSWDDFDSILGYLNCPVSVRLQNIFCLHNEHRMAFTRLLTEFTALLFGHVDFKFMTIVMNASLLGILCVFWRAWDISLKYFVLIPFMVFSPQPWVNMMHPIQYSAAYLMTFFAIFLARSGKVSDLSWALAFATLSAYTNASGILVFPVLLLSVLLSPSRSARLGRVALVSVWMLGVALLYFHNYHLPYGNPLSLASFQAWKNLAQFFFTLTGAALGADNLALLAGIIAVSFFIILAPDQFVNKNRTDNFFYLTLLFLLLNAGVLALGRSGMEISAMDPRYRLLSLLIFCSCLGCALRRWPRPFARNFIFIALSAVTFAGYIFSAKNAVKCLEAHRKVLIVETAGWMERRHGLHYPRRNMEHAGAIFDAALEKGTYVLPPCVSSLLRK